MKGICFKEPLFHKVVKGEKTQTRRIINHFGNKEHYGQLLCHWGLSRPPFLNENDEWRWELQTDVDDSGTFPIKPKYKVGEIVYLKEPYLYADDNEEKCIRPYYKFSTADVLQLKVMGVDIKWKNKLFMPESAARYFVEITGVRAEKLKDISDEDCMKEGIQRNPEAIPIGYPFGIKFSYNNGYYNYTTPQEAYAALINEINGKGTWEKNPWVWVYDFELINK